MQDLVQVLEIIWLFCDALVFLHGYHITGTYDRDKGRELIWREAIILARLLPMLLSMG